MAGRRLEVVIAGDADGGKKAFEDLDETAGRSEQRMQEIGRSMTRVGQSMTLGVTLPLLAIGKVSIDAASDLNESMSKVGVVFDDAADDVLRWSETSATAMGISRQEALESAGTFGNLFRALGVGIEPAAEMSQSMVQLASDLASFNNADPSEVLDALRSGLVGEAEPLRRFGVSLSAARIESEALSSGLVQVTGDLTDVSLKQVAAEKASIAATKALKEHGEGSLEYRDAAAKAAKADEDLAEAIRGKVPELTDAQKAQAAFNIIMKDTVLAQGDFARTSDGAANQTRIMKAELSDAAAEIGTTLLPIFTQVVSFVADAAKWFSNLPEPVQQAATYLGIFAAAAGPALWATGSLISNVSTITTQGLPALKAVLDGMPAAFGPWGIAVGGLITAMAILLDTSGLNNFEVALKGSADTLRDIILEQKSLSGDATQQWVQDYLTKAGTVDKFNAVLAESGVTFDQFMAAFSTANDGTMAWADSLGLTQEQAFRLAGAIGGMDQAYLQAQQSALNAAKVQGDLATMAAIAENQFKNNSLALTQLKEDTGATVLPFDALLATFRPTIDAAQALSEATIQQTGDWAAGAAVIDTYRAKLIEQMVQSGMSEDAARGVADALLGINAASPAVTQVVVDDFEARRKLADYSDQLARLPASVVTSIYAGIFGGQGYSEGGWVEGVGNGDTVPAMLTPGEFVVSKEMLAGRRSMPSAVASGGGGGPAVQVIVRGSVITDRELDEVVFEALERWRRHNGGN